MGVSGSARCQTEHVDPVEPVEPAETPEEPSKLRRRALVLGPLLVLVGIVVIALGVPWQIVAGALALFVLWLVFDG